MKPIMKGYFVFLFCFLAFLNAKSQDCEPAELAKIPGSWKSNKDGSIQNLSTADVTQERAVLAKIHESVKGKYTPIGGVLSFSNSFSIPLGEGKNWAANPYGQSMRFLEYVCKRDPKNPQAYVPNLETSAVVTFYVNQISASQELGGAFNLFPAELPEDHPNGYFILEKCPKQQGDRLLWEVQIPSDRHSLGERVYILTYKDKSPMVPLTKGEYLKLKIPLLKKSHEESLSYHKEIDPDFDAASKRVFDQSLENLRAQEELIQSTEALLESMSPEELSAPAILERGETKGEFKGFKEENDPDVFHLVKPNLAYFDPKLPKWVPQLISVSINYDINEQINFENIQKLEQAIDYVFLQSLLGKTQFP